MRKYTAFLIFFVLILAAFAPAQMDKSKRLSPPAQAQCKFADGKSITVDYSSPRVKGRKIFGGLVAYDQVWRTGANEATTFVTNTDVNVGGKVVPAGSYTLFTLPSENKWALIISKTTGEWGTQYSGESNDFLRTDMAVSKTSAPVENFTISFEEKGGSCTLNLDWENTRASISIAEKK